MFTKRTLQELIENKIVFESESLQGYKQVKCPVCNDYKVRAGFKFEHNNVHYNCFNCKAAFSYDEGNTGISINGRKILNSFLISNDEIDSVIGYFVLNRNIVNEIKLADLKKTYSLYTPEVKLPDQSFLLGKTTEYFEIQKPLLDYCNKRKLNLDILTPYFSLDKKMKDRIIFPCIRNRTIIFWQARTIDQNEKKRYDSPSVQKDAILWGYDNIFKQSKNLFITEGIIDAHHINGVALLGSSLNEAKIEILNKSNKRKIVVIDKDKNGSFLAKLAVNQNWDITFLSLPKKDINSAVIEFGELNTIYNLMENVSNSKNNKILQLGTLMNLDFEILFRKEKV